MSVASAQAWIKLRSEDPEAESALAIARGHLEAAGALTTLRRVRLIEMSGPLPEPATLAQQLHASTQFYNPAKERLTLRTRDADPTVMRPGECALLVSERGGERRMGAERWWRQVAGARGQVREARVWLMTFAPGTPGLEATRELATLRNRRAGLFCNPHTERCAAIDHAPPLEWIHATGRKRS